MEKLMDNNLQMNVSTRSTKANGCLKKWYARRLLGVGSFPVLLIGLTIVFLTTTVVYASFQSVEKEEEAFYPGVWQNGLLDRAETLVALDRQLEAIRLYEKYLATDSLNTKAWRRLAQLYSWNNQPDSALHCYEKLAQLQPKNKEVLRHLAQFYVWRDRQKQAIRVYHELAQLEPTNIEYHKKLAQLYSWNDMPDKAILEYEKIIRLDSTDVQTMKTLAQNYFWTNQAKKGVRLLQKIVAMQPDSLKWRKQLAQQYEWNNEPQKALKEYREIFTRQPDDTLSLRKLAQLSMMQNRNSEAERYYRLLMSRQPENARLHLELGKLYLWSNRADRAVPQFEAYLQSHPDDKEALALLGEAQRWSGQWDRAKKNLQKVLLFDANSPHVRELLADIREQYGPLWENKYSRIHDSNQLILEQIPVSLKLYYTRRYLLSFGATRYRITDGRVNSTLSGMGIFGAIRRNLSPGLAICAEISPHYYTSKWNPLHYRLRVIATAANLTAQLAFYRRETQEGVQAILDKIIIKGFRVEIYWQATKRWYISSVLDRGLYSDDNRKTTGLIYSQYTIIFKPQISIYGFYSYEDFDRIYPTSLPYWTPDRLHTGTLGTEVRKTFAGKFLCIAGLGLTHQQGIYSRNAHLQLGFKFTRFDQFTIRYEELGSDVYNSKSLVVFLGHRF